MDNALVAAAVRRFPLLGRPRPACPALPERLREIADAADTAQQNAEHAMADAAHALNKAALLASDCGLPYLARDLCWRHIDAYRNAGRELTVLETRFMLEPVLNLARLQIRADSGNRAMHLLHAMYQAVTARTVLTVEGHTLPIAHIHGDQQERRRLREWVWSQLIGEGIRAYALAARWDDAVRHAEAHRGIGVHLMEGRQAAIIAPRLRGDLQQARAQLDESTPTQPWEHQVSSCLRVMCTDPADTAFTPRVADMMDQFTERPPVPGYASYRARLGLTTTTLASVVHPATAAQILGQAANEAIEAADGYAARDVLGFKESIAGIDERHRQELRRLAADSGLGVRALPEPMMAALLGLARDATNALESSLLRPNHPSANATAYEQGAP